MTTARSRPNLTSVLTSVEIAPMDPADPRAQFCLQAYFSELNRRFETGFDPALSILDDERVLRPPTGLLLVAIRGGDPIGCGALWFHGEGAADIKRMWVADSARGLGLGRRLLAELENRVAARGLQSVRLETNRALAEAISMYRSASYIEVAAFNDEPYAHHWFEKQLQKRR